MILIESKTLTFDEKNIALTLWNNEYPASIVHATMEAFESYLDSRSETQHYLLYNESKTLVGWAFTYSCDEENWFGLIIHSDFQHKGYGKILIELLKQNNPALSGWVIDHDNSIKANGL